MVPTRQLAQLIDRRRRGRRQAGARRRPPPAARARGRRRLPRPRQPRPRDRAHREPPPSPRWERGALDQLRDGRAEQALALYRAHDRVHVDEQPAAIARAARRRLVGRGRSVAVGDARPAPRRRLATSTRAPASTCAPPACSATASCDCPAALFAVGDHVLVKRNDLRLGVVNGDRGRVVAVDPEARQLTLDCHGDRVTLDADYLDDRTIHGDPTLLHGYAMTVHVAQGLTVDHAFVLAGPGLDRELGYTALSRGRESNQLYAARDTDTRAPSTRPPAHATPTRSRASSSGSRRARPRRWRSTAGTPTRSLTPDTTSPEPPRVDAPPRRPAARGFQPAPAARAAPPR